MGFIQFEVFMNIVEFILYWHQQHALTQDYLTVNSSSRGRNILLVVGTVAPVTAHVSGAQQIHLWMIIYLFLYSFI